jgi:hypothetical protein
LYDGVNMRVQEHLDVSIHLDVRLDDSADERDEVDVHTNPDLGTQCDDNVEENLDLRTMYSANQPRLLSKGETNNAYMTTADRSILAQTRLSRLRSTQSLMITNRFWREG